MKLTKLVYITIFIV